MDNWNIDNYKIDQYLNACIDATVDNSKFDKFKTDNRYTPILEHVSLDESKMYLDKIDINLLLPCLDRIKENDKYGSPVLYDYPIIGTMSPTTIRYVKNTFDIISHFGNKQSIITEIGGGYGGLCKTIDAIIGFDKYYIFDLYEANLLSTKYLSKFDVSKKTSSNLIDDNINIDNIDLVISNYAFSEIPYSIQMEYINKIISKCKKFYMVYNTISEESSQDKGLSHTEFCEIMSNFNIDIEYEHDDINCNKILYGQRK